EDMRQQPQVRWIGDIDADDEAVKVYCVVLADRRAEGEKDLVADEQQPGAIIVRRRVERVSATAVNTVRLDLDCRNERPGPRVDAVEKNLRAGAIADPGRDEEDA